MKKHLPSAIILSALLLVLCLYSVSVENDANGPNSGPGAETIFDF